MMKPRGVDGGKFVGSSWENVCGVVIVCTFSAVSTVLPDTSQETVGDRGEISMSHFSCAPNKGVVPIARGDRKRFLFWSGNFS